MPEPLVLLHGFGGTHRAWDQVLEHLPAERYRPVLRPDLPGHGDSPVDAPLPELPGEGCVLCGYSLGGRIALQLALAQPERVRRLVLVAATAGIEDPAARQARREQDEALAAQMESMTVEQFADRWQAQPIFAGTPPEAAAPWREDLLRNDPARLAAALRRFGPGSTEPMWDRLAELTMPVALVVGERDERYVQVAGRLAAALPQAELHVIPGAGHGLPREAPEELAGLL